MECVFLSRAKTKRREIFQHLHARAIDNADKGLNNTVTCFIHLSVGMEAADLITSTRYTQQKTNNVLQYCCDLRTGLNFVSLPILLAVVN